LYYLSFLFLFIIFSSKYNLNEKDAKEKRALALFPPPLFKTFQSYWGGK